jgi:hypothetical protein
MQHDFKAADTIVGSRLLPEVGRLCSELDDTLDAAGEVMQCCVLGRRSLAHDTWLIIGACAGSAALFFCLVGVALVARAARRRAGASAALPTYGLPSYSGKLGAWAL